ncbi:MAG: fused MFS/spermidine synthase [Bacteroidia bacterium]
MKKLIPVILIEGASVMIVELCSAKLLSPYFGNSLYVWASVLSVTLGGLASGYFYGAKLCLKENIRSVLAIIILLSSISLAVLPLISKYLIPNLVLLDFKISVLLSSMLLIFPSVFLLGSFSPVIIQFAGRDLKIPGNIAGTIYGYSTIGGIISTLAAGFYMIPELGISNTLYSFSFLLLIASLILMKSKTQLYTFIIFIASLLLTLMIKEDTNKLFSSYGILGKVEVEEVKENGSSYRRLIVDGIIQTEIDTDSKEATMPYLQKMDSLFESSRKHGKKALLIGLGGGVLANKLVMHGYDVESVELDSRIYEAAIKYFHLSPQVKVTIADGRKYINNNHSKYSMIILDVFHGEVQPPHLISWQSFSKVNNLLSENGKLVLNWHGYYDGELGKGTQILISTIKASGFSALPLFTGSNPDYRNTILFCEKSDLNDWDNNSLITTDDKPSIELANAEANLRWRVNYHNYYRYRKQ